MAGQVEVEPAVAEGPRPGGCRCSGRRSTITPPGFSSRAASRIASPGSGRCSSECQRTTAAKVAVALDLGERLVAEVGAVGVALEADGLAARCACRASISVPSPAPTSRIGPGGAITSIRAASRPRVRRRIASPARQKRCPAVGPVPVAIGRVELLGSGAGSVVAGAAGGAEGQPGRRRSARSSSAAPHQTQAGAARRRAAVVTIGSRQTATRRGLASRSVVAQVEVVGGRSPRRAGRRPAGAARASSRRGAASPSSGPARRSRSGSNREQPVERRAFLVEDLHVARRSRRCRAISTSPKRAAAEGAQLARSRTRGSGKGSMISSGRPKVSRFGVTKIATPSPLEHPRDLGEDALGVGHVLERLDREHRGELAVGERQVAHVGDDRLAILAFERARLDVDADRLARREQVVAVADAAAEVEHPSRREVPARPARRRRRGAARSD